MTIHPMGSAADRLRLLEASRDEAFMTAPRLLTLAAAAAGLGLLVSALVLAGLTTAIDEAVYALLFLGNGAGLRVAPWLWEAVRDVTALGSTIVLTAAVAGALAYLLAARRMQLAFILLASALGATGFNTGLKWFIARARPEIEDARVTTYTASFPSGHALLSVAIILTIGGILAFAARRRQERAVIVGTALGLGIAIGFSRVLLGVHWPSDVVAGWLFGIAWASLTLWVARQTARPGQPG